MRLTPSVLPRLGCRLASAVKLLRRTRRPPKTGRRLFYETLEDRRLLAATSPPASGYGDVFTLFTDATLATPGLVGSYVDQSLGSVDQLDWRGTPLISGQRVDPSLFFPTSSLGSRVAVGVTGGTDDNWDQFSVQWDGVVQILAEGTRLTTRSDDGSRLWLDLDGDKVFENPQEHFDNAWGTGRGASLGETTPPLTAGIYTIRIQFQEGDGDNTFSLIANPIQPVGTFAIYTDGTLSTPGLIGSYVNQNLGTVDQPDWRATQTIAGTRVDAQIAFTGTSWGRRADVGLTGGSDADWDNFSVQWDGVVQVQEPGTRLATLSDDSSRLWIDLNHDGQFDNESELANNNWGQPQAQTMGLSSPALATGVYRIRVQYEERYWGNTMQLVAGPPLTVRTAYIIPSNRTPQASAVANLQDFLPRLQSWFADQMDHWGFGAKSFTYETLPDGVTPSVHVVNVDVTDAYLREDLWGHTLSAAAAAGVRTWSTGEVWLVFSEAHLLNADGSISGGTALGAGYGSGSDPGVAMLGGDSLFRLSSTALLDNRAYAGQVVPEIGTTPLVQSESFPWFEGETFSSIASSIQGAAAHELSHAFGLSHDFRNDFNFRGDLMGNGLRGFRGAAYPDRYPSDDMWLSYGAALALSVSRYFRSDLIASENTAPALTVRTSGSVDPVQGLLQLAFEASDASGLAAALLNREGDLVAELPLSGDTANATFATPYYVPGKDEKFTITVFDRQGNRTSQSVTIRVTTGFDQAPQPCIQVSDSQPAAGQSVILDASSTNDADDEVGLLLVEWDLDGDGVFDTSPTTDKTYTARFSTAGTRIVAARITDPQGTQAVATPLTINVHPSWQNPANPYDVQGDGLVVPLDVLLIIMYINMHPGDSSVPHLPAAPPPFYDVNGDGAITALDVLSEIHAINLQTTLGAEAEPSESGTYPPSAACRPDTWIVRSLADGNAPSTPTRLTRRLCGPLSWTITDRPPTTHPASARRLPMNRLWGDDDFRDGAEAIQVVLGLVRRTLADRDAVRGT